MVVIHAATGADVTYVYIIIKQSTCAAAYTSGCEHMLKRVIM